MSASVPVYLLTSLASPQAGALPPDQAPQSSRMTLSLPESGLAASLSFGWLRVSLNAPLSEPVLAMSTMPSGALSPGRRPETVNSAVLSALLPIVSVPVLKVFAGLADEAVKSAPEATVTPTAASTVPSVARVRRGCRESVARRDIGLRGLDGERLRGSRLAGGGEEGGSAVCDVIGWMHQTLKSANAPT